MNTLARIKEALIPKRQNNEIVNMQARAEKLRRQINQFLQHPKNNDIDNCHREVLADISEDIYQIEILLGNIVGAKLIKNLTLETY